MIANNKTVYNNKWHTCTNTSTDNLNVTFGAIDANAQDKQRATEMGGEGERAQWQLYLLESKQYFDTQIYYLLLYTFEMRKHMHASASRLTKENQAIEE